MQVLVRDNNVDQALRVLKKKMQREGVFREMKLRSHYEKPSERKTREKAKHRYAEGQQESMEETFTLLLHLQGQQFKPVFPDDQQPPRKMF